MDGGRAVRPLGLLEQFSSARHSLGFYHCVANTCWYHFANAVLNGSSLRQLFQQSLKDVVEQIPILQVVIQGEDGKTPAFVQATELNLAKHIKWQTQSEVNGNHYTDWLTTSLQAQHIQPWPHIDQQPPWLVICTESATSHEAPTQSQHTLAITFAVHHAVGDGISTRIFHTRLMEALNRHMAAEVPGGDQVEDAVNVRQDLTLPSPVEELTSWSLSWPFFLGILWNEVAPKWPWQARGPWCGAPVTTSPNKLNIRRLRVLPAELKAVLAKCKTHKLTLTPLLHAVVAHSLANSLSTELATSFAAQTAADVRRYLSHNLGDNDLFGTYDTAATHLIDSSTVTKLRLSAHDANQAQSEIWSAAQASATDLQKHLTTLPANDSIGLLSYVSDWRRRCLGAVGKPRPVTWEISNLGSWSGKPVVTAASAPTTHCQIVESMLTQSTNVGGPAFAVNVSSIRDQGMTVTLTWQESVVDEEVMADLEGDLKRWFAIIGDH